MRLSYSILAGLWIIIVINLLMSFGAIYIFIRMAPAIEIILDQNDKSLMACETMLASLAQLSDKKNQNEELMITFAAAQQIAQNNITENAEPELLSAINRLYPLAFENDILAKKRTVEAIMNLADLNRSAMRNADLRAQRLGNAGAWGVVFMALTAFAASMLFKRQFSQALLRPMEDLYLMVKSQQKGDTYRRLASKHLPKDMRIIFDGINEILDKNC